MKISFYPRIFFTFFCAALAMHGSASASTRTLLQRLSLLAGAGLITKALLQPHYEEPQPDFPHKKFVLSNGKAIIIHAGLFPQEPFSKPCTSEHLFSQFCPHGQMPDLGGHEPIKLLSYATDKQRLWFALHDYIFLNEHPDIEYISANAGKECIGRIAYSELFGYPHTVHIHLFEVIEEYQRNGIGRELDTFLHQHLKEHAPSIEKVTLSSIDSAIEFYQKNGYSRVRYTGNFFEKKIERTQNTPTTK